MATTKSIVVVVEEDESTILESNNAIATTLATWKKALVTKEDYLHHHKIFGGLALLSFFVRFLFFFSNDMAFASHPQYTIPTVAFHWLLTASSFQFRIPKRRIRDGGRIWPQYRWHALFFTTRSVLFIAVYWYEQIKGLQENPNYDVTFAIVMLVMAAADTATYAVGNEFRSNTIRDLEGPGAFKFVFSTFQFNATAFMVLGIRRYSMPFFALFSLQLTPFVGTLRRKGVFTSKFWGGAVYVALLLGGFLVQAYQYHVVGGEKLHLFGRCVALSAALLRLTPLLPSFCWPLQNKFVIWTMLYFGVVRPVRPVVHDLSVVHLRLVLLSLLLALAVSCYFKVKSGYYPSDVKDAKRMAVKSE